MGKESREGGNKEDMTSDNNITRVEFKADGTTCHSCAEIIKRQALKVDGVKSADFSYEEGKGSVSFDSSKTDVDEIFRKVEEKGYTCSLYLRKEKEADSKRGDGKRKESESSEYFQVNRKAVGTAALILGLVVLGFFMFRFAEVINLPAISKDMSLGLIFLIGLLTGFHCVAMCGGFVVGYTAKAAQEGKKTYKSHILYGVGKTLSYTIIGALFGLIGSIIAFTPQLRGIIAIFAGIFLLLFGLKMLGVFGFMRKFGFKQPVFISRFVAKIGDNGPLVIGLLNGLMIACGPLQAMYVLAAGTGSMLEGAKMLFVFGLGTLPVMLGFGYLTSFISSKATHTILKLSGIVVIILGLLMLNNGFALTGNNIDLGSIVGSANQNQNNAANGNGQPAAALPKDVAVLKDGYQEIHMDVDASGWSPNKFTLKANVPVKWFINVKQLTSCNRAIQVPAYNLKFDLKMGEQEIDFIPGSAGTIRWSCWMGMIQGTFIVQDELPTGSASSAASATTGVATAGVQQNTAAAQATATETPSTGGGCGCGMMGGGSATGAVAGTASCH
jgi:uncharacterized protein